MGAAKRRAQARWKGIPDPGPTPPVELTQLVIVIPRKVAEAIDELHKLVEKHYPHRNDFLEDLLKEGLKSALQAQQAAIAQMQVDALAAQEATRPEQLVQLATEVPKLSDISARLKMLRGDA
jgi:hypothetical protein